MTPPDWVLRPPPRIGAPLQNAVPHPADPPQHLPDLVDPRRPKGPDPPGDDDENRGGLAPGRLHPQGHQHAQPGPQCHEQHAGPDGVHAGSSPRPAPTGRRQAGLPTEQEAAEKQEKQADQAKNRAVGEGAADVVHGEWGLITRRASS